MLRRISLVCALVASLAAYGQDENEDQKVMGNWVGEFTGASWAERSLSAQISALGGGRYDAFLTVGKEGQSARVHVKGDTPRGGHATFAGAVNLGWSKYRVTAGYDGTRITGTFSEGTDSQAFTLERVEIKSPTLGQAPPPEAIVLMDGTDLDEWQRWPLNWTLLDDGATEVSASNLATVREFGDHFLHIEFRTPFKAGVAPTSQGRGNSGAYVMGRYEVQILDSFAQETADNFCGGLYSQAVPLENATLPPLEWQTYDIEMTAPRFDDAGTKTKHARITVRHNGILIHDDVELSRGLTPYGAYDEEGPVGRLLLQDHGSSVQFRNAWVLPR
jgi:hypothetical protein